MGLLRLLLAVCVFCSHTGPLCGLRWLEGGLSVELFFVISGFYMQLVLSTRYTNAALGKAWVRQFYKARYFRLLPVYLLGSALAVSVALMSRNSAPLSIWRYLLSLPHTAGNLLFLVFLGFTNATMFLQDVIMFTAAHGGNVHWSASFADSAIPLWKGLMVPQAWSLGIELSFYLLAPCLLNMRSRSLVLIACCSLTLKLTVLYTLQLGDPWTNRFFPFELGYFLLGALAYRYRKILDHPMGGRAATYCVYLLAACIATLRVPAPVSTLTYPMVLACVVPFMFRVTSKIKVDRWIGELSYPFYIFHSFAITVVVIAGRHLWHGTPALLSWLGLGLTLALSATALILENRFIEPWRGRLAAKAAVTSDGAAFTDRRPRYKVTAAN